MPTILPIKDVENKLHVCRCKYCIKFCEYLKKRALKIISFKNKKMKTNEEQESYEMQTSATFINKILTINMLKIKKRKVKNHFHHAG